MKFGSLFSGIGGFDLGFERAGMIPAWQCEIDKDASSILNKRFNVEVYDDIRKISFRTGKGWRRYKHPGSVDVICGGFPCQDVSVAGKRAGLAGERSGLWFEFARIIDELGPRTVVIENVPGLLSSNEGRDFAVILSRLVQFGYGVCWRVLDAQYFGVPQRRRRVFIVGSLGNGRAAEILFERESVSGNPPSRREAGKDVANTLATGSNKGRLNPSDGETFAISGIGEYKKSLGTLRANGGDLGGGSEVLVTPTLHTGLGHHGWSVGDQDWNLLQPIAYNIQHNDGGEHRRKDRPNGGLYVNETDTALTVGSTDMTAIAFSTKDDGRGVSEIAPTVQSQHTGLGIAWHNHQQDGSVRIQDDGLSPTVSRQWGTGGNNVPFVGVRRLTPTECERLQGFPDGWTAGQSDSARYRQLGNAVAVPVAEWIGKRIMEAEAE